jgi:hypothetical protein
MWAIIGDSITDAQILSQVSHEKGVVSIDNYAQSIVIADNGAGGSQVLMDYFDDPKVSVNILSLFLTVHHLNHIHRATYQLQ